MKIAPLAAWLALSAAACSLPAPIYPLGDSHPACASAPVAQTIVNPDALVDSSTARGSDAAGDETSTTDHSAHQGHKQHHGHGGHGQ